MKNDSLWRLVSSNRSWKFHLMRHSFGILQSRQDQNVRAIKMSSVWVWALENMMKKKKLIRSSSPSRRLIFYWLNIHYNEKFTLRWLSTSNVAFAFFFLHIPRVITFEGVRVYQHTTKKNLLFSPFLPKILRRW